MLGNILVCCLVLAPVLAVGEEKSQLPDAPGRAATIKVCGSCHGAELMIGKPHSEEGWSAIVTDMVQRGAEGTDDEYYEIVQYLTKNIKAGPPAKVNVNKASAKSIEIGLQISSRDAQAIVSGREKGEFKSIDDLKKLPGLDAGKIEAKKERIAFE